MSAGVWDDRHYVGAASDHGYARVKDHLIVVALPAEGADIRRPIGCTRQMLLMQFTPDGARAIAKALRKAARDAEATS